MVQIFWSERDGKYWVKNVNNEVLWFESSLAATDAARQAEKDKAVAAEIALITKWLKAHGMRQIANMIERGDYK